MTTKPKFYITTAIDYPNGIPHLGHAFEKTGADCIARYRRLRGDDVQFVVGMDEHAQKVAQAADEAGVDRQEWIDDIAEEFRLTWAELAISNTDFIRTTEDRHRAAVEELFRRIQKAGYLTEGTYEGHYCIGCEAYKLDRDLDENGRCPLHPTREITWLEEPNYFFQIGKFRDRLLQLYEERPEFVQPRHKYNEIVNVVREWTDDHTLSVSRSRVPWGIPWPGDPDHTVYVWFDALINYLSATGFPDERYLATWPADVHVIGPDILRFHASMWPAMLMAADVTVPHKVWCHGWVKTGGERFSKSAGTGISLREIMDYRGIDALRYFLLREVPWDSDGNFTMERFDIRYTAELADDLGNLVSRVTSMIGRYLGGTVPAAGETELDALALEVLDGYQDVMDRHLLHQGADHVWRLVDRANAYVEQRAPWTLDKQGKTDEVAETLGALARALARIGILLSPYMPGKSDEIWAAVGLAGSASEASFETYANPQVEGAQVTKPPPLFPKPDTSP